MTHVSFSNQLVDDLTKPFLGPRLHDLGAKIDLTSKTVLCRLLNYFVKNQKYLLIPKTIDQ